MAPVSEQQAGGAPAADGTHRGEHALVTGFPAFTARHMAQKLLAAHPAARVSLLVQPKFTKDMKRFLKRVEKRIPGATERVDVLQGDVVDMHLGLSSQEYKKLARHTDRIYHLAGITYVGADESEARRVNVEGTRNVIELARDTSGLMRLVHFSTVFVAGDREGVILEDELVMGQSFRNPFEATKYEAELAVRRAMAELPVTVLRPSIVVGDSKTGEIDRFEGPYYVAILLVTSPALVPLPLPGDGVAPLNVVPVDYVVDAAWVLAHDPRAAGRTFHLVDPNPLSSRCVYQLIAEKLEKKLPAVTVPSKLARAVLKLPLVEKMARPQRAAFEYVNHLAIYNSMNTYELLAGTGVACPPITAYLDKLIEYVKKQYRKKAEQEDVEDALDP